MFPADTRRWTTWRPMNPVPPITRIRIRQLTGIDRMNRMNQEDWFFYPVNPVNHCLNSCFCNTAPDLGLAFLLNQRLNLAISRRIERAHLCRRPRTGESVFELLDSESPLRSETLKRWAFPGERDRQSLSQPARRVTASVDFNHRVRI